MDVFESGDEGLSGPYRVKNSPEPVQSLSHPNFRVLRNDTKCHLGLRYSTAAEYAVLCDDANNQ